MKTCPRCDSNKATIVTQSPVQGAWEVYLCSVCLFSWRSTEPNSITDPKKYNKIYKIDPKTIPLADRVPIVPERLSRQK
jgi:vanillate/4-hydroxybenzoate decarboxylase subunit D